MSNNAQDRQAQGEVIPFSPNISPEGNNIPISIIPVVFPGSICRISNRSQQETNILIFPSHNH